MQEENHVSVEIVSKLIVLMFSRWKSILTRAYVGLSNRFEKIMNSALLYEKKQEHRWEMLVKRQVISHQTMKDVQNKPHIESDLASLHMQDSHDIFRKYAPVRSADWTYCEDS